MVKTIAAHTWIVVPAYNEERYLPQVLAKILTFTPRVIVIDDGSSDQTASIAHKFPIYFLHHRLNLGKGAALKTACEFAFKHMSAEAIIMLDADEQHDPHEIPLFLQALEAGNAVVFGVRQEPKDMPWLRLKVNRLSSFLTYLLFGRYLLDIPSGYKAFTKSAYEKLAWNATNYAVELEIAARTIKSKLPYGIVKIKTIYHDTTKGMSMLDAASILKHLVKLKVTL